VTRIVFSRNALSDVHRLVDFLADTDPGTAIATAGLIEEALQILVRHPEMGRRTGAELRELVISRGRSGYLALYHFDVLADEAIIVAIRHQRESGYHQEDL